MDAGKLDQRITLQRLVAGSPAQDEYGAPQGTWTDVATVWAEVNPQSGREFIAGQAEHGELLYKVAMRYRADVDATMRLVWQGHTLEIVAPPARFGLRNEGMLLTCKETTP